MSDHTEAEVQALDGFTKELIDTFIKEILDRQLCGACISAQVLNSIVATIVANGFMSPDMVMNISANAINLALNPENADDDHVDRGTIYASQVH